MFTALRRPNRPRRGVTLVEMLVVVALVVLMMVILVQIFQSALGAMTASRTNQELDVVLRSIDSMIRSDLGGVTAKMTPPNDPALKSGYFEYIENAPADLQGEDTDDILAFTSKAPEGQYFTGRQFLVAKTTPVNPNIQPITITSQVAEVIYFLRNGNLYRRVFLVAPDRIKSLTTGNSQNNFAVYGSAVNPVSFGPLITASWQGMNDISCRPAGFSTLPSNPPIPNDLGDLTNRENRAFRPRFANDFSTFGNPNAGPDGIPDDNNADGVPDYYPTLYYNGIGNSYKDADNNPIWSPNALTSEPIGYPGLQRVAQGTANSYDVYAFPFIYPGMYSVPAGATVNGTTVTPLVNNLGWRHGLGIPGTDPVSGQALPNHYPLSPGDNLPAPTSNQTWWGFPTWRETMTPFTGTLGWADPAVSIKTSGTLQQPLGLRPIPPTASYSLNFNGFPTPLTQLGAVSPPPASAIPPFSDGAGSQSFVPLPLLNRLWEDDLILTNVRSFDVKAYDVNAPLYSTPANGFFSAGYQDLGYGAASFLAGLAANNNGTPVLPLPLFQQSGVPVGFGHEGRIPPLTNDFRFHPSRPTFNVGDNNQGVIRLVHTFDTWSTDYTNAPDSDILLNGYFPNTAPIYPSFPPPYPSPLRGIQIQIRVVDPRNEKSKVLTIRHDFTDKLTN